MTVVSLPTIVFPVSGVEVFPLIPPLVAFLVACATTPAGVSGAFMLLPFQVSALGFTSPAVSPTNLIYNIVAIPGGLYRYIKEGRMAWPLTWVVVVGTLPGVFAGALIRIYYLPDPRTFKLFVGVVLLYLGVRLLYELTPRYQQSRARIQEMSEKFQDQMKKAQNEQKARLAAGLPADAVVRIHTVSLRRIEYEFWDEKYSFGTVTIFTLAMVVGMVGGIYGIGGGAIIAPFCVSVLNLPIYTVAGAALASTFLTSIAGVIFFTGLAFTAVGSQASIVPDWALGILFGIGGLLGTYTGARLQKYMPDRLIKGILGAIVTFLALQYIVQYFV